jgi:2-iminobutanoate/2-iminopropanoate deaminase
MPEFWLRFKLEKRGVVKTGTSEILHTHPMPLTNTTPETSVNPRQAVGASETIPMKKVIASSEAPAAVGPYSQAVAVGNFLFCAGQIPLDPATGALVEGDITVQTERVLQNVTGVLRANGMTLSEVVKSTVFMTDLGHFAEMNAVYARFFSEPFPARSTIQIAALPKGAQVEIEVIAVAAQ